MTREEHQLLSEQQYSQMLKEKPVSRLSQNSNSHNIIQNKQFNLDELRNNKMEKENSHRKN